MPYITENDQQRLAVINATEQEFSFDHCVQHLVAEQAKAAPDSIALVFGDQVLRYDELDQRANQLAHYLRAQGIGPEKMVGVCLDRSCELIIALLGILKSGGAYVPLDPLYPAERLSFILQDVQAPVLLTEQRHLACLASTSSKVLCLDANATELMRYPTTEPDVTVTSENLAYVIYTSGSTGWPKGVAVEHRSLLNLLFWHQLAFGVTAADRATQLTSPAFDATGWEIWPYLACGASIYLPDNEMRVMPTRLRDWLLEQRITVTFVPTALAEQMLALPWPPTCSLRFLLTGADTLRRHPVPGLPFTLVNNYGPTEATVVATSGLVPPTINATLPPSIGRPIANVEVYLLDDALQMVPFGAVGELYIGGMGVARGYHRRPELTAQRFIPHPFRREQGVRLYKTGDLARFLPDGQLSFLGRQDYQVKIRGYRIELEEIMTILDRHPAVQANVVVAGEDAAGEKQLVAYLVPVPGKQLGAAPLREFLGTYLPDYMIPATFVLLDALPVTPNGKINRAALPAPHTATRLCDAIAQEPCSPTEERVARIVTSLLGLERIDVEENFFMLGGHSLLGTQMIAHIAEDFQVELPLRTLFEAPTVRKLAIEIEKCILARIDAMSDEEVQRLLVSSASVAGEGHQ